MSARDNAAQSLINGGYSKRQAEEILSLVCGEAREQGFQAGRSAAIAEALAAAADELHELWRQTQDVQQSAGVVAAELRVRKLAMAAADDQAELCRCGHPKTAHYTDATYGAPPVHGCDECLPSDYSHAYQPLGGAR
jgi:CDGSH-type Zn-finger protein